MPKYPDLLKQTTVNISESAFDLRITSEWTGLQLYLMMTPLRTVRRIMDQTPPLIKYLTHILTMPSPFTFSE